jgi:translation initiation factor 6
MSLKAQFESTSEIGSYVTLTNTFCMIAEGAPESFYRVFE